MSHSTTTRGRRTTVVAAAFAALLATTTACGTQQASDVEDLGSSSLSVPRHGAVEKKTQDATSANRAEHRLEQKKFSPPPAGMRVPD